MPLSDLDLPNFPPLFSSLAALFLGGSPTSELPSRIPVGYASRETFGTDDSALHHAQPADTPDDWIRVWRRDVPEADRYAHWLMTRATDFEFYCTTSRHRRAAYLVQADEAGDAQGIEVLLEDNQGSKSYRRHSYKKFLQTVYKDLGQPSLRAAFIAARVEAAAATLRAAQARGYSFLSTFHLSQHLPTIISGLSPYFGAHVDGMPVAIERYCDNPGTIYSTTPDWRLSSLFQVCGTGVTLHGAQTRHARPVVGPSEGRRRIAFLHEFAEEVNAPG